MAAEKPAGRARELIVDVAIGLLWAAAIVAVALFASGASTFIYVDF